MDLKLNGKKALLAGASKSIGRKVAELLAAEGVHIAFSGRDNDANSACEAALRKHGVDVHVGNFDVTDPAAYKAWVDEAATALGGCDIFISFATAGGPQASEDSWKAAYEVEVMGTWRGIDAAMPYLEKSDAGSIVILGTTVAFEPAFGPQPYAAMKAAIVHQGAALAQKLGPQNIRVNTVSPGPTFVEGGAWDKIKQGRRELYDRMLASIPMGRLGNEEDVANAIVFLCSGAAGFITGTNIVVDGGMSRRVQF